MARRPTVSQVRRYQAALDDAEKTMRSASSLLDLTNLGYWKYQLLLASDRAATALRETQE